MRLLSKHSALRLPSPVTFIPASPKRWRMSSSAASVFACGFKNMKPALVRSSRTSVRRLSTLTRILSASVRRCSASEWMPSLAVVPGSSVLAVLTSSTGTPRGSTGTRTGLGPKSSRGPAALGLAGEPRPCGGFGVQLALAPPMRVIRPSSALAAAALAAASKSATFAAALAIQGMGELFRSTYVVFRVLVASFTALIVAIEEEDCINRRN
mmetsp:Transcript_60447/g.129659  ORF Transcript_60447/g.129659 Transcript_60447/m.129659 type:complete len:211 (+) Transcript_60447:853-1485(+)